jgi:hypothetical protein
MNIHYIVKKLTFMKKIAYLVIAITVLSSCAAESRFAWHERYRSMYPGKIQQRANTQSCGGGIFAKPLFKE